MTGVRQATDKILEMVEEGILDKDTVIMSCLKYMSEDDVAVYDCIKGAEMLEDFDIVEKGLDWFREHYPKEYMVLLD